MIKPSPTVAITGQAIALKAQGKDIISLSVGEPDFDTPEFVRQSGIDAINTGKTRYTALDGTADLKQAIVLKFKRDNDLDYAPEEIVVSSGAKQAIYNLMQATLNAGDEVLIPAPYWVSYPDMALLAEATPVIIDGSIENRFKDYSNAATCDPFTDSYARIACGTSSAAGTRTTVFDGEQLQLGCIQSLNVFRFVGANLGFMLASDP